MARDQYYFSTLSVEPGTLDESSEFCLGKCSAAKKGA